MALEDSALVSSLKWRHYHLVEVSNDLPLADWLLLGKHRRVDHPSLKKTFD